MGWIRQVFLPRQSAAAGLDMNSQADAMKQIVARPGALRGAADEAGTRHLPA
ncbi:MAG: hypothetical protein ABSH05_10280 [Bryobacteraceae bacterium]|jgi:hypothetical protein